MLGFLGMVARNIHGCFDCRYGRSKHLGSQRWELTIYMSVLGVGCRVLTTFGFLEMGARNIHECFQCRDGRSQCRGS